MTASKPVKLRSTQTSVTVSLAVVVGLVLRGWYLTHRRTSSDEAVAGLMASNILRGHFYVFYWGQQYGGVEPYVVALVFSVLGQSGLVLHLAATLFSALAAVLTWRIAQRIVIDRRIALMAGALTWVAPEAWISTSSTEFGFRGVTLTAGLTAILFALRALDESSETVGPGDKQNHSSSSWAGASKRAGLRTANFAGLGISSGIGWWASPEVVYLLVPASLIGFVALRRLWTARMWLGNGLPGIVVSGIGFCLGALPWLCANVRSSFASLSTTQSGFRPPLGYVQRLGVFFRFSGPLEVNLRIPGSGLDLVGSPNSSFWQGPAIDASAIAILIVLLIALGVCVIRQGRALAIAIGVCVFPFLYAMLPATWYWADGRYVTYVGPLLAMLLAVGMDGATTWSIASPRSGRTPRGHDAQRLSWRASGLRTVAFGSVGATTMAVVVLIASVSTAVAFRKVSAAKPVTFTTDWGNPDHSDELAVSDLLADGITRGYADYWVAYDIDFISHSRLAIATIASARAVRFGAVQRSPALLRAAGQGSGQAWLFETPWGGPAGIREASFLRGLRARRIRFRVFDAGRVTAIVPAQRLSPSQGLTLAGAGP